MCHVPDMRRRSVYGFAALLCGLLAASACSSGSETEAAAGVQAGHKETVPVTVASVVEKDVPMQVHAIGAVEPYSTVTIKAQIEGQVARVHFQEGQRVRQGDLLFTIDPRPFEAALRQAEANLSKDQVTAKNAQVEAQRRARLLSQEFISKDDYDNAVAQAAALRAAVAADEAAVENARLQLQYCYIRSAIDGRIGRILVHEGNVVKSNETEMAVVNQIRPIYVTFSVPEQRLPEIRQRAAEQTLAVQAFVAHQENEPVAGTLSFINNTVDATTGTVVLKGRFANDDERLWPGQFVDVALTLATHPNALLVPAQAVQVGQQGQYVYVVTADLIAEFRPVETGDVVEHEIIISKGLQPGERVVTDGQVRLAPGLAVEIKNGSAEDAHAAAGT